jgi:hypothetical protein
MSGIIYGQQIDMRTPPSEPNHVTTLGVVEDMINARWKQPVRLATTTSLVGTYAAGSKTLTASTNEVLTVDGILVAVGNRVLVTAQTTATQNGIYVVSAAGSTGAPWVLTRADDFDTTDKVYAGVHVHVTEGNTNKDVTFVLTTDAPITLDTTGLVWTVGSGLVKSVQQKKFTLTGDGTTSSFTLTHNWNQKAVSVELYLDSTGETVITEVVRALNTVTINFAVAPLVGTNYGVILRAEVVPA